MVSIHKCEKCSAYTMLKTCSKCGSNCVEPKPAKFSIEDKYGNYRREAKFAERKEKGQI